MKKKIVMKITVKMLNREALGYIKDSYESIIPEGMSFKKFIQKAGGESYVLDQFRIWYENRIRMYGAVNLEEVELPCLSRICYPDDADDMPDLVEGQRMW
jgi:hypothetical protein